MLHTEQAPMLFPSVSHQIRRYAHTESIPVESLVTQHETQKRPSLLSRKLEALNATALRFQLNLPNYIAGAYWKYRQFSRRLDPKARLFSKEPYEDFPGDTPRQQQINFLNQTHTPVELEKLAEVAAIFQDSNHPPRHELGVLLAQHLERTQFHNEQFADRVAESNVANLALSTTAFLSSTLISSRAPWLIPLLQPVGLAIAEYRARVIAQAGDHMNIQLRNVYPLASLIAQVHHQEHQPTFAAAQFGDIIRSEDELFTQYARAANQSELRAITPAALNASVLSLLLGDYGISLGTVGIASLTRRIFEQVHKQRTAGFSDRFEVSKVKALHLARQNADRTTSTRTQQQYDHSQDLAEDIRYHENLPMYRMNQFPLFTTQLISSTGSFVLNRAISPFPYILAQQLGQATVANRMDYVAVRAAHKTLQEIRNGSTQKLDVIADKHHADRTTIDDVSVPAVTKNISIDPDTGIWKVAAYLNHPESEWVFHNAEGLSLQPGINFILGEKGVGKSLLCDYLIRYCHETSIPVSHDRLPHDGNLRAELIHRLAEGRASSLDQHIRDRVIGPIRGVRATSREESPIHYAYETGQEAVFWQQLHEHPLESDESPWNHEQHAFLDAITTEWFNSYYENNYELTSALDPDRNKNTGNQNTIRLALSLIDLPKSKLVILDETLSNLDPIHLDQAISIVTNRARTNPDTVFMIVTHNMEAAQSLTTRAEQAEIPLSTTTIYREGIRPHDNHPVETEQITAQGDQIAENARLQGLSRIYDLFVRLLDNPGENGGSDQFQSYLTSTSPLSTHLAELVRPARIDPKVEKACVDYVKRLVIKILQTPLTDFQRRMLAGDLSSLKSGYTFVGGKNHRIATDCIYLVSDTTPQIEYEYLDDETPIKYLDEDFQAVEAAKLALAVNEDRITQEILVHHLEHIPQIFQQALDAARTGDDRYVGYLEEMKYRLSAYNQISHPQKAEVSVQIIAQLVQMYQKTTLIKLTKSVFESTLTNAIKSISEPNVQQDSQ